MEKYRRKLNEQSAMPAPAVAPGTKTSLGYVNLGLPSRLTLDDDDELNWADNSLDPSVDQEYCTKSINSAVTGHRPPQIVRNVTGSQVTGPSAESVQQVQKPQKMGFKSS